MDIAEHTEGGCHVVAVAGRLDSTSSPALEEVLCARVLAQPAVIVDLQQLQYVSSAGLRVLLKSAKAARGAQHRLALAALTPQVQEVFDISGFTSIFQIFETRRQAIEGTR
jgi:anti-sigma B factor antagonist